MFRKYLSLSDNEVRWKVLGETSNCNVNSAVIKLDTRLHESIRLAKKKKTLMINNAPRIAMEKANEESDNYMKRISGESGDSVEDARK